MNFKYYFRRLQEHNIFRKFAKEYPNSYFCSGFFTIDKEGDDNKQHFDFFIPETGKIASFQMENDCKQANIEPPKEEPVGKIALDFDIDFEELEKKIYEKMRANGINNRIQKMIFSLQKAGGKDCLAGTVFISMFGLIRINFDVRQSEITDFEKKSLFDMINIFKKN
ncbi:MAG TPA: hypothetical protein VMC07_00150 [Candidatus Omnitrophota bacterium]|nr:hypothetical protein [Candidatus Omnitrophota bacterium]